MGNNPFMISEGEGLTAMSSPYPIYKATHQLVSCLVIILPRALIILYAFFNVLPMGCSPLSSYIRDRAHPIFRLSSRHFLSSRPLLPPIPSTHFTSILMPYTGITPPPWPYLGVTCNRGSGCSRWDQSFPFPGNS